MTENTCPQCENHCPADALKCGRGARYFGVQRQERDPAGMTEDERLLALLRHCGHHLHHNAGHHANAAVLFEALSTEEKTALETILQKCLQNWQG